MDIVDLILFLLGSILIIVINAIIIGTAIYYTIKLVKIVWVSIDVNKWKMWADSLTIIVNLVQRPLASTISLILSLLAFNGTQQYCCRNSQAPVKQVLCITGKIKCYFDYKRVEVLLESAHLCIPYEPVIGLGNQAG